ncbi:MAG: transcription antitermination factor NusB [Parvibaculaceae bacterium]|nr:transcription antitermination factor NusB [Parvibaculaceae bacterium]
MSSQPTTPPARNRSRTEARRAARMAAVQALYQMDIAGTDVGDVIDEFVIERFPGMDEEGEPHPETDVAHFTDLLKGVVREQLEIDPRIDAALARGWTLSRLDSILRAILRAGVYEMQRCRDVPAKVVINEYVDIAHAFFTGEEPAVVNAVIDRVGRDIRVGELK